MNDQDSGLSADYDRPTCPGCGCTFTAYGALCTDCYRHDAAAVAGHEFNWQTGYCACGWAGPAIDEVPRAHAEHVAASPIASADDSTQGEA